MSQESLYSPPWLLQTVEDFYDNVKPPPYFFYPPGNPLNSNPSNVPSKSWQSFPTSLTPYVHPYFNSPLIGASLTANSAVSINQSGAAFNPFIDPVPDPPPNFHVPPLAPPDPIWRIPMAPRLPPVQVPLNPIFNQPPIFGAIPPLAPADPVFQVPPEFVGPLLGEEPRYPPMPPLNPIYGPYPPPNWFGPGRPGLIGNSPPYYGGILPPNQRPIWTRPVAPTPIGQVPTPITPVRPPLPGLLRPPFTPWNPNPPPVSPAPIRFPPLGPVRPTTPPPPVSPGTVVCGQLLTIGSIIPIIISLGEEWENQLQNENEALWRSLYIDPDGNIRPNTPAAIRAYLERLLHPTPPPSALEFMAIYVLAEGDPAHLQQILDHPNGPDEERLAAIIRAYPGIWQAINVLRNRLCPHPPAPNHPNPGPVPTLVCPVDQIPGQLVGAVSDDNFTDPPYDYNGLSMAISNFATGWMGGYTSAGPTINDALKQLQITITARANVFRAHITYNRRNIGSNPNRIDVFIEATPTSCNPFHITFNSGAGVIFDITVAP